MAAVWLAGLAPAAVLPGGLNRFVFVKLSLVAGAWACALLAPRRGRLQRPAALLLAVALATLTVSALLGSAPLAQLLGRAPRYEGLVSISVYVGAVLIGAWLLGPGGDERLRLHLVRATAVSALLLLLVAVAQTVGLDPLETSVSRPGSLLGNATEQGAYGAGVAGLALAITVTRARAHVRWAAPTALVGGVGLVALSGSRGAVLGLVVAVVVVLVLAPRQLRRPVLAVLGSAVLATILVPLTRDRMLLRSPLSQQTVSGRAQEWAESLGIVAGHPLLGVGPSGFVDVSPSVQSADYVRLAGAARLDSPHSLVLQLAISGGVVLVVAAALAGWLVVRSALNLRSATPDASVSNAWAVGALAALAGWLSVMLTHFTAPGSTPFFCLLAGSLLSRTGVASTDAGQERARVLRARAGAVPVCAALLVLVAAGAAEIPLRTGLVDLASADASSADAAFGLAHGLRPWDADLDAQIAHALVSSPRPAGVVDPVDTYLDRAASALPQDPAVLADRGLLEARRGHAAVSRELLDRAHQLAPHDPVVLLLRGQVRSRSADLSGAIADLEASASLSPRNRLPLDVLAGLYAQAGRSELAAATLARAQALGR